MLESNENQSISIKPPRRGLRFLVQAWTVVALAVPSLGQGDRETEQVRLELEKQLRSHLRKLNRWQVSQLLRTEQEVDNEQKRRANTSTNPHELDLLADDEDVGVRFFVAANRHTALSTRMVLASDVDASVRSGVAIALSHDPQASSQEKRLMQQIGVQLANDGHVLVRMSLASNEKLPDSVYVAVAADPDYAVRTKLARNSRVPSIVLRKLAQDSVLAVQEIALRHRSTPSSVLRQMIDHPNLKARLAVGSNTNTPVSVLDSLASDPEPSVRKMVASHPRTELGTLNKMALDSNLDVVVAVANHPNADRHLLMELAYDDRDGHVRVTAQKRLEPLLRREIREDILERWKTDNTRN